MQVSLRPLVDADLDSIYGEEIEETILRLD
jgi:hypothetical protein